MKQLKVKLKSPNGEEFTAVFNTIDYTKLSELVSVNFPEHDIIVWKLEKVVIVNNYS